MIGRLVVALPALAVAACTGMQDPRPMANVPEPLRPGTGESLAMIAVAKGVQIYACKASPDEEGIYRWVFVAPEATLFDGKGRKIGTHFAGPKWESNDGSRIAGTLKARVDAPQADAIPWLLMDAKSVGPQGTFSRITSVQRLDTVGGAPPRTVCSEAIIGAAAQVPYSARYYFYAEETPSLSSPGSREHPSLRSLATY
jgi:hypothetical protein